MALQLVREQPTGLSGNYWKITDIQIYNKGALCVVSVALFKDQAASDSGKTDIKTVQYTVENKCREEDYTATGDTPHKLIYNHLKTLPEFSGAVDV